MKFVNIPAAEGATALQAELLSALQAGKRVLWFVAGGSNIPLSVQIMDGLPDYLTKGLTVTVGDERFGELGHPDSNAAQLFKAGFPLKAAAFIPVLDKSDLTTTAQSFAAKVESALANNEVRIAQLGIGPDSHIAGVLPHSPAVNSQELVASYRGPDYERITLTLPALQKLTSIYVFAYGAGKREALLHLRDGTVSPDVQPAQFLKTLPDVTVYNDQLEEGTMS